jgi:hypothetical protein
MQINSSKVLMHDALKVAVEVFIKFKTKNLQSEMVRFGLQLKGF